MAHGHGARRTHAHAEPQRHVLSVSYQDSIPEQNIGCLLHGVQCMDDGEAEVCRPTWTKESDEDTMTYCTAARCMYVQHSVSVHVSRSKSKDSHRVDEVPRRWIDPVKKEENNSTCPGRGKWR